MQTIESIESVTQSTAIGEGRGLARLSLRYLRWMETMNYSRETVRVRTLQLKKFLLWCGEHGLVNPRQVTKRVLDRYVREVAQAFSKGTKRRLATSAQHGRLVSVRSFFRWLTRKRHIPHNPASEMDLPKTEHRLPKLVLAHSEVERILSLPDTNTPTGIRDRAILETFYSTGIRRCELISLRVDELYPERGLLLVNQGKGKKDRVVPIGDRALFWIDRYVKEVRPNLLRRKVRHQLFLSNKGNAISAATASILVREYLVQAGITTRGACHMLRHSMATVLLENGVGIRHIQEMLGHADLKTTQIYTHVNPTQLKQAHAAAHPARLAG